MCLLIMAHRVSDRFPLLVAANRDEFHARPTTPSGFWREHPGLLAGRDREQGGTWMGITRENRFAAVTNFRDPSRTAPAPRSRGELCLDYLIGDTAPGDYLAAIAARGDEYAGFNLLVGAVGELWYYDNNAGEAPLRLPPGVFGLSNARLDTPWPKVELGKRRLREVLAAGAPSHDALAAVVADRRLAAGEDLEARDAGAGMERMLSAQFIVGETYGTRATTTLWAEAGGLTHWRECNFGPGGLPGPVREEAFRPGQASGL